MAGLRVAVAALLVASALAGCVASGRDASASNFTLTPQRLGWNVGDEARFTLTIQPGVLGPVPNYTVDRDFAIAELALDEKGLSFGGEYRTRSSGDVSLRLWRDGAQVAEAVLGPGNESVEISLNLPEKLHDAEYTLELMLFKVGWIESEPFRVNVP